MALSYDGFQFFLAAGIHFFHVVEDYERVFQVSSQVEDGVLVGISSQGCSVGFATVFVRSIVGLACAFTHDTFTDDQSRTLVFGFGFVESLADLLAVVSVYFDDVPSPGAVFHGGIFRHDFSGLCRELDVVGVIEHDQVVQSQMSGNTSSTLGYFFLYASVGDVGIDGFFFKSKISGACSQEFGGDGSSDGEDMALSQRTGSVFDASHNVYFGMSRSG